MQWWEKKTCDQTQRLGCKLHSSSHSGAGREAPSGAIKCNLARKEGNLQISSSNRPEAASLGLAGGPATFFTSSCFLTLFRNAIVAVDQLDGRKMWKLNHFTIVKCGNVSLHHEHLARFHFACPAAFFQSGFHLEVNLCCRLPAGRRSGESDERSENIPNLRGNQRHSAAVCRSQWLPGKLGVSKIKQLSCFWSALHKDTNFPLKRKSDPPLLHILSPAQ